MADRVEFDKKTRGLAFARCGGKCEKCSAKLKLREGEYDHIIPYFLTQDSTLSNCQVLCVPCHRGIGAKTADDQKMIAKVKRIHAKHFGLHPKSANPIRSAGFRKTRQS